MEQKQIMKQVVVKLSEEQYTRVSYIAVNLGLGLNEIFCALIPSITLPQEATCVTEKGIVAASPSDLVELPSSFDREALRPLLDELNAMGFAVTLEKEFRLQLLVLSVKGLRVGSYERLGRWCHPKRWTEREQKVKPIAEAISRVVFGKIIDRVR